MTGFTIMSRPRSLLAVSAFALSLVMTGPFASAAQDPAAAAVEGPAALITVVGTQGIQALGGAVSSADRVARLNQLFVQDFDINGIGLFALGRYRAMATPQETEEFFRLYPAFTVRAFNSRLDDYRGAPFHVTGKRKIGDETVVSSEIAAGGGPVRVDWHLIKVGPGREYRIADVSIAGTSMRIALRDQFASWIQGNGGRFGSLLAVMRQQIARQW